MASTAKSGPGKAQKKGGRVTPSAKSAAKGGAAASGSVQSNRYTPPIDRSQKVSPRWFGILIVAMFALGVLIVILNYAGLLPGGVNRGDLRGPDPRHPVPLASAAPPRPVPDAEGPAPQGRSSVTPSGSVAGPTARPAQPRRSMMVALAMPPPSHIVSSP